MKLKLVIPSLLIFIATYSYSQYPNWKNYGNGNAIRTIYDGGTDIWLSTNIGIIKWNKSTGAQTIFDKTNSGIQSYSVNAIHKDVNGNMWFGGDGLTKFDGVAWNTFNTLNSALSDDYVQALGSDANGVLWIGTWNGIDKYDAGVFTNYNSFNNTTFSGQAISIIFDKNGTLLVGTDNNGLYKLDATGWVNYNPQNSGMLNSRIKDMVIDGNNNLWASSYNCGGIGGLTKFDGTTCTPFLQYHNIGMLGLDSVDNIWYCNPFGNGLCYFKNGTVTYLDSSNSAITNTGWALIIDNDAIWYNTYEKHITSCCTSYFVTGIYKYDFMNAPVHTSFNKYNWPNEGAYSFDADQAGNIWFGAEKKIGYIQNDSCYYIDTLLFPNFGDWVTLVKVDPLNNVWAVSQNKGVYKYNGSTVQYFDSATYNWPMANILDIKFDALNNPVILLGFSSSPRKVLQYDGTNWNTLNFSQIPESETEEFTIDVFNNVWVRSKSKVQKLGYNSIPILGVGFESLGGMISDSKGNIFVGSSIGKIFKIDTNNVLTYTTLSNCNLMGLGDAYGIADIDALDRLWLTINPLCSSMGTNSYEFSIGKFENGQLTPYNIHNSGIGSNSNATVNIASNKVIINENTGSVSYFIDSALSTGNDLILADFKELFLFPNPSKNVLLYKFLANEQTTYAISIIDLEGRIIFSQNLFALIENGEVTGTINTENINIGNYILRIAYENKILQQRFIKME